MVKVKVKKGDKVQVINGEDKGKIGKVEEVLPKDRKVLVEGVNIVTKHQKPKGQKNTGGRLEKARPIYIDKVLVVCKSCNKPTRTGIKILDDGKKVRVCKKCGKDID